MTKIIHLIVIGIGLLLVYVLIGSNSSDLSPKVSSYPSGNKTYPQTEAQIGCAGNFSDAKEEDIFLTEYKNHWFTWIGTITSIKNGSVSLDMNGGLADVQVDLKNKNAAYDLLIDSEIVVRFVMDKKGGCFLPFIGKEGKIVTVK
jgi:hypothetical protein